MKNQKIFVLTILFIFLLSFVAVPVLAVTTAPVIRREKNIDFSNGWSIDESRSRATIDSGKLVLPKYNGLYDNSAVAWTNNIGFYEDIKKITINGNFLRPSGTSVFCYITYGDQLKEHKIRWGQSFEPDVATQNIRLKIFLSTNDRNVTPTLDNINIKVELQDRSDYAPRKRDKTRVYELSQAKKVLERYYEDFGHYPIVRINQNNKDDQWRTLTSILDSASEHTYGNYLWGFVGQISGISDAYKYGYLSSSSGSYYILWSTLEQGSFHSDYLEESWRGSRLGIECDEPRYCLHSDSFKDVEFSSGNTYFYEPDNNQNNNNNNNNNNNTTSFNFGGVKFVKNDNSTRVYLEIAGRRIWMRSPEILFSMGGSWSQLIEKKHLFSTLAKFVKSPSEPDVYMIQEGLKRPMLNPDMLYLYGSFGEVVNLDKELIQALPETKLLRAKGNTRVWYIDGNTKRWIYTPEVLRDMGFSFDQVVEVSPEELKHYREGQPFF